MVTIPTDICNPYIYFAQRYYPFSHAKGSASMATTNDELSVITPADWVPGPLQGSWTYDDYAALPYDGNRYEIVNGVLLMTPAPTPEHQSIATRIAYYLFPHIDLAGIGLISSSS